jgi:molybdopterin-guanine dinucleotide biosynthesis protein A
MNDDVIAIVPAGGKSRRLGPLVGPGGKATLAVGGESMLVSVCRTLAGEARRVIVVAAPGQPLPPLGERVEVIRDRVPFAGPVAAIHAGLEHAGGTAAVALVVACDIPRLAPAVVRLLVAAARRPGTRWAVPMVGGHPQVLVSAISSDLEPAFAAATAAGVASPRAVLARLARAEPTAVCRIPEPELAAIDPTLGSFADIDTAADLDGLPGSPPPPS